MFGYLLPDRWVLPLCEDALYRAFYCGVCRAMRPDVGQRGRLMLSYDAAFLALLCDALEETPARTDMVRCPANPFRKRPAASGPAVDFAARAQAVLSAGKIADDAVDGHRMRSLAARAAMFPHIGRMRRVEQYAPVADMLAEQREVEAARDAVSIERAADPFARFLGDLASRMPPLTDDDREAARWLGYHVGKWMYVMDALDDYEDDRKHGRFNALHRYPTRAQAADACRFLLTNSGAQAHLALELLPLRRHDDLLRNVLVDGCALMSEAIIEGRGGKLGRQSLSGAGRFAQRDAGGN